MNGLDKNLVLLLACAPNVHSEHQKQVAKLRSRSTMSENIIQTTDSTFDQDVLQSDIPVLVDFWAEWCGPCKQIGPFLEDAAIDFKDRLVIAKLNIDHNSNTPGRYGVRGIPTLMLFKQGQIEATKIGAMPKSKLYTWIEAGLE